MTAACGDGCRKEDIDDTHDLERRDQLRARSRARAAVPGHAHREAVVPAARQALDGPGRLPAGQQAHRQGSHARGHRARLRVREGALCRADRRRDPRGESRVDADRRHRHVRRRGRRVVPVSRHAVLPRARPQGREGLCAAARRAEGQRQDRHRARRDARPPASRRADSGRAAARARYAALAGGTAAARRTVGAGRRREARGGQCARTRDGEEADRRHVGVLDARRVSRHVPRRHPRAGRAQGARGPHRGNRGPARADGAHGDQRGRSHRAAQAQPEGRWCACRARGRRRGRPCAFAFAIDGHAAQAGGENVRERHGEDAGEDTG